MVDPNPNGELLVILKEYSKQMVDAKQFVDSIELLPESLSDGTKLESGVGLLDVKNSLLLDYMVNLSQLMLRVLRRCSIADSAPVERLVELRTTLERIRPVEQKLSFHIEKLLGATSGQGLAEGEIYSHRPRPELLNVALSDNGSEGEGDEVKNARASSVKKYVPPKLVAMHYDDETPVGGKKSADGGGGASSGGSKRRQLSNALLREMHAEYSDLPAVLPSRVGGQSGDASANRAKRKEKTRYEEENFVRLQVSSRERREHRRSAASATLDSLLAGLGDYGGEGDGKRKAGGGGKQNKRGYSTQKKKSSGPGNKKFKKGKRR